MKDQTEKEFKNNKELGVCVVLLQKASKFAFGNCFYERCFDEYENLNSCIGWKWTPNSELEDPNSFVEMINSYSCSVVSYKNYKPKVEE